MKTLKEIIARLAELAVEVRDAVDVETVEALGIEKKELLERKAELEELEKRKQGALDLEEGKVGFKVVDKTKEERNKAEIKGVESIEYKSAFLKSTLPSSISKAPCFLFSNSSSSAFLTNSAVFSTPSASTVSMSVASLTSIVNSANLAIKSFKFILSSSILTTPLL